MTARDDGGPFLLIVEDESLIARYLAEEARLSGFRVSDTVDTVETAFEALARARPDVAVLDRKLKNRDAAPVADMLMDLGIPFLFVSGSGPEALAPRHRHAPCVFKPFEWSTVRDALSALLAGRSGRATA